MLCLWYEGLRKDWFYQLSRPHKIKVINYLLIYVVVVLKMSYARAMKLNLLCQKIIENDIQIQLYKKVLYTFDKFLPQI